MLASSGKDVNIETLAGTHTFDHKLDGVRAVAYWDGTHLQLVGRNGSVYIDQFPEIVMRGGVVTLDGEIVADDGCFASVVSRVRMGVRRARMRAESSPCRFVAFDVLSRGGEDVTGKPFRWRRALLEQLTESVTVTSADPAMLGKARGFGVEGVVAKRNDSPYQPGVRSLSWLKYKHTYRITMIATGCVPGGGGCLIGGLEVVLLDGHQVVPMGVVGCGFSQAEMVWLKGELDQKRPVLVEVDVFNVSKNRMMRSPVYVGVRVDGVYSDASVRQLDLIPTY